MTVNVLAGYLVRLATVAAFTVLLICNAAAEEPKPLKGTAIVIGQAAYENLPKLANPERDARDMEALLDRLGFETRMAHDENARKLRRSVDDFIADAEGADVALVYYSGHGIEAGGVNYLIPTDADLNSLDDAGQKLISLQDVLDRLRTKARITILLLDACRNSPFPPGALVKRDPASSGEPIAAAGLGLPRGMSIVGENPVLSDNIGEVIGFAAEPGMAALDGPTDTNSPYAAALLKHLGANQSYEFGQVMTMVTEEVYLATGTRQRPWINASLRRLLSFGGRAEEASADDARLSSERRKLLLAIAATPQDMRAAVENLARDQSLPLDPLYGMLKELQVDTTAGPEELDKQLRIGAENLRKLFAEKVTPLRKDSELIRLAGLADRAQNQGAIALAKEYRAEASARADELVKTLDRREQDVATDRIELASTYADEAQTAILDFDYATAAAQYGKAFEQAKGRDNGLALRYWLGQGDALRDHGMFRGDNQALLQATQTYQAVINWTPSHDDPEAWRALHDNLGFTFRLLGERNNGTEYLVKAVQAYETALDASAYARSPAAWAKVQNNLGTAYMALGIRETGIASLEKAAAALEAALKVRTRDQMPIDWAETQTNIGSVLGIMGDRQGNLELLRQSAAAFEGALAVFTPEHTRYQWAEAQNNLGGTLVNLGRLETGVDSLYKAVDAFNASMTVLSRDRFPLRWAGAQQNLASALSQIGERENNVETLWMAVSAYRAALAENTRERVPWRWAAGQNDMGDVLYGIGSRVNAVEPMIEAITAYQAALLEITVENAPLDWARTMSNVGTILIDIYQRQGNPELLKSAVTALEAALTVRRPEGNPLEWARTQGSLANAYALIGAVENNVASSQKAVAAFDAVLQVVTRERDPYLWATAKSQLANTLRQRGLNENNLDLLAKSVTGFEAASTVWTREATPMEWAQNQYNLALALSSLGASETGIGTLEKAIAAYEAALTEWTRERAPQQWANIQQALGRTWLVMGTRTKKRALIERGRRAVEAAWDIYRGDSRYDAFFQNILKEFDTALAR